MCVYVCICVNVCVGNYIISLSQLTRWLAGKAEEAGVEIYAGFAADEVLYNDNGAVIGVRHT